MPVIQNDDMQMSASMATHARPTCLWAGVPSSNNNDRRSQHDGKGSGGYMQLNCKTSVQQWLDVHSVFLQV